MEPIKFSSPYFDEEEAIAAADVVRSQWVVGGAILQAFEEHFAKVCGASYAIGVSSWTTGAFLVLKALGIGAGDEVIVPSSTFIASVNVIVHAGATPVFADIDPHTWNIDPADVEAKITTKTKMIIPVDQIGLPCDIDRINSMAAKHGVLVLQDAACAFGSVNKGRPVGSLCDVTVFSLHARKIITTGEGGMIVTQDSALAKRLKCLRHQGMSLTDYDRNLLSPTIFETYPEIGYNFRMTDIQAAIGLKQLDKLPYILQRRREIALNYQDYFQNHPFFECQKIPIELKPNWQSYQIRLLSKRAGLERNELMDMLYQKGIPTRRGVMASHLEPAYKSLGAVLPQTERIAASTLLLPIHPALTHEQQAHILNVISELGV